MPVLEMFFWNISIKYSLKYKRKTNTLKSSYFDLLSRPSEPLEVKHKNVLSRTCKNYNSVICGDRWCELLLINSLFKLFQNRIHKWHYTTTVMKILLLKLLRHSISNHSVLTSEFQMIQISCLCSCLFSVIYIM